jgi:hypothetical protein
VWREVSSRFFAFNVTPHIADADKADFVFRLFSSRMTAPGQA